MANKRKFTTAIVAGVTAVALLLGGTFAWTSISQQAKNEAIVDINPGGRLHDDFNGTNKDVYVENFGNTTTGVPIYARVRLYEYMEIGQQAGDKDIADETRKAESLIEGASIGETDSWAIYKYGETSAFSKYWQWTLGNDATNLPIYLPTFNMNKDSLAADINGTYEGNTDGDIVHYDDYKTYTNGQAVPGTEIYDWDDNDAEEETEPVITTDATTPRDSADVYQKSTNEDGSALTHTAQPISSTAEVMSMAEWIAAGSQPGPYWVFDEDGWAYWAQAIQPGETTGLLLDGISMSRVPDDNWYYGINVVGQFATAGDIYQFEGMTPAAEELFVTITGLEQVTISGPETIIIGETATFTATRMALGGEAVSQPTFQWAATAADGTAIDGVTMNETTGDLTVGETVAAGTQITVEAIAGDGTATTDGETTPLSGKMIVTVLGTITITTDDVRYTPGTPTTKNLSVALGGVDTENANLSWTVKDIAGNTLTNTTVTANTEEQNTATLNIGAEENASKIIVTATYKSADGKVEFSGTLDIYDNKEVATTDNKAGNAYAILTDDGSENGTSAMYLVRSYESITENESTYEGKIITKVWSMNGTWAGDVKMWGSETGITRIIAVNPIYPPKDSGDYFREFTNLEYADLTKMDFTGVTDLDMTFMDCSSLTELKLPDSFGVDAEILWSTFNGCSSLKSLDLPDGFGVKAYNLAYTFANSGLTELELPEGFGQDATDFLGTFEGCKSLTTLNLPQDFTIRGSCSKMFRNCLVLNYSCEGWNVDEFTSNTDFNTNAPGVTLPLAWQTTGE